MSAQPAVLQVVILRDGLLVGTEVFVPGQYTIGSAEGVDLRLDDPTVQAAHAYLYFQNGRSAIQDAGTGAVFVNGHRVNACEVRPVDEVTCGPFTLKVRVLGQRPATAAPPKPPPASSEVTALLGGPPPARPAAAPSRPQPVPAPAPSTVVSPRRMTAAPAQARGEPSSAPTQRATPQLRAVEPMPVFDDNHDARTESVVLGDELPPTRQSRGAAIDPLLTVPLDNDREELTRPEARPGPATRQAQPAPKQHARERERERERQAARPPAPREWATPSIPAANEGRGKPHLFVEVYWGDVRKFAGAFAKIDPKKKLMAGPDETAKVPLYGFGLDSTFNFAEQKGDGFRVYIPAGAAVERAKSRGDFEPVMPESLEVGAGQKRCVTLGNGNAVRLTGDDNLMVVAYVQPAIPKPFVNPLRGLPWLAITLLALFGSAFGAFVVFFVQPRDSADFEARNLSPVAVRLIQPPKPEEKKKMEEKIEKIKKKEEKKKEVVKKEEKPLPKTVAPETKKALKSLEKLTAAGPAMKDLLAAVDKMGSGPGAKNAKTDYKLSGLLGKAPVANAGIGTFGLGGGGAGGMGIKGSELLRGKGGGGIGALGTGSIGKGTVGGAVSHAVARNMGAQGTIDKEAVAKVINSHLGEVSSCYERALLKEPGLAGKIVLEWQITLSGAVGYAKTKSSTMKSAAVESCILASLKNWKFPPAKGAGVVITYPFMFNAVGY